MRTTKATTIYYTTKNEMNKYLKEHGFKQIPALYIHGAQAWCNTSAHVAYITATDRNRDKEVVKWHLVKPEYSSSMTNSGYKLVGINRRVYTLHRLVALTWCAGHTSECDEVDHVDGNKLNNCVENLQWVSHTENMRRYHERKCLTTTGLKTFVENLKEKEPKKQKLNIIKKQAAMVEVPDDEVDWALFEKNLRAIMEG